MNFDQIKMNARQIAAMPNAYQLTLAADFANTIIFGKKSPGIFVSSSPITIIGVEKSG